MPATRRESSADSAARFLRTRSGRRLLEKRAQTRSIERRLSRYPAAPAEPRLPRRIACDFAEPTLRLIHDVLLDALHAGIDFSDRGALLLIAEQMVATALGMEPCDDPPLTDREVR